MTDEMNLKFKEVGERLKSLANNLESTSKKMDNMSMAVLVGDITDVEACKNINEKWEEIESEKNEITSIIDQISDCLKDKESEDQVDLVKVEELLNSYEELFNKQEEDIKLINEMLDKVTK